MATKKKAKATVLPPEGDPETGEVAFSAPALTSTNNRLTLQGGASVTLKKMVNRVLLKHGVGETVYITIQTAIRIGKEIKGSTMAPAKLVTVTDHSTGQEMDYIVSAVVEGLLNDNYPKAGYVGGSFAIYKEPKAAGKRYNNFSLAEISVK